MRNRKKLTARANAFARWLRRDATQRLHGLGYSTAGMASLDAFRRAARLALEQARNVQQVAEDVSRSLARQVNP